jgi:hypothetical protein
MIAWQIKTLPPITSITEPRNEPTPGTTSKMQNRPKTLAVKASIAMFRFMTSSRTP